MPLGATSRTITTVEKEILVFPAGLDAIQSVVLSGSGVEELPSAVSGGEGRLVLRAGTILQKIDGDPLDRYEQYDGSGDVAGILGDNIFFYSTETDEPADMLFHNCVFNKDKIVDYDEYGAEDGDGSLNDALHTCRFEVQVTGP
jgi:hypothetical protein